MNGFRRTSAAALAVMGLIGLLMVTSVVATADTTSAPFRLTSAVDVVARLGTVYYPRPAVLLFTDPKSTAALTTAARHNVEQLHTRIPSAFAAIHEFPVASTDVAATQLLRLLMPSQPLPCMAFFGSAVMSGLTTPGSLISSAPSFVPIVYEDSWTNATAMRQWILSMTPTQYSDPVTYRAVPALNILLDTQDIATLITTLVQNVRVEGSRSTLPEYVLIAYAHVTAAGSQEFLAALSNLVAQAGERVLTVVTEDAALATAVFEQHAATGFPRWHQIAAVPFSVVQAAVVPAEHEDVGRAPTTRTTFSLETLHAQLQQQRTHVIARRHVEGDSEDGAEDGLLQRTTAAVAEVLAEIGARLSTDATREEVVPGVAAAHTREATLALHAWSRALSQAAGRSSPLLKLSNLDELQHELRAGYNAIKVVFFLRESDRILFSGYRKIAEAFASRVATSSVVTYKSLSGKTVTWRSPFLIKVFWIDAERQAEVASHFRVASVPDVALLLPVGERGDDGNAVDAATDPDDRKIGVHHINVHDLTVVDTTTSPRPQTAKEAETMFPSDADQLIRFLASPQFATRAAFNLHATTLRLLGLGRRDHKPTVELMTARLDRQYFPSAEEEEPGRYLYSLFTNAVVLPAFDEADYQESVRQRATAKASMAHRDQGAEAGQGKGATAALDEKAQQQKAKLQREIEARQRAKEERIREKARKDAEAREAAAKKLQEAVQKAVHDGETSDKPRERADQPQGARDGLFSVMRPRAASDAADTDVLAQFHWWQAQAERMAAKYVFVEDGVHLHFHTSLEIADS